MAFDLPQRRLSIKQIQTQKRNVPIEQIIATESYNPLAVGVQTGGDVLGDMLKKRAQSRKLGEQLAKLESLSGVAPGSYTNLDPNTASAFTMASIKQNQEGKKRPLQGMYTDPITKKVYQPFYDEKSNEIDYQELRGPQVILPKPESKGTLVQSGLFDENGQPIMVNNKSGKAQTISLPGGPSGHRQTKVQLAPTSQTRAGGEFAATVIPEINSLKQQIADADAAGYIGPLGGRYADFMTRKIGSTGNKEADYMLGKLRSTRDFLGSATMKAHVGNRGGGDLLDRFLSDMDTGKQSAAVLQGELDGLLPYMQGYVAAGKGLKFLEIPSPISFTQETKQQRINRLLKEASGYHN